MSEKITYSKKLTNPKWQRRRSKILERDDFQCQICGDIERTLHVHHMYYIPKLEPWEYPGNALITLCEWHHLEIHTEKDLLNIKTDKLEYEDEILSLPDNPGHVLINFVVRLHEIIDKHPEFIRHLSFKLLDKKFRDSIIEDKEK